MKMKVYEVIAKIRDIDDIIADLDDDRAVEMLEEYKDSILSATVDI